MITSSKSSKSSNELFFAKNNVANYGNFRVQICCVSKVMFVVKVCCHCGLQIQYCEDRCYYWKCLLIRRTGKRYLKVLSLLLNYPSRLPSIFQQLKPLCFFGRCCDKQTLTSSSSLLHKLNIGISPASSSFTHRPIIYRTQKIDGKKVIEKNNNKGTHSQTRLFHTLNFYLLSSFLYAI